MPSMPMTSTGKTGYVLVEQKHMILMQQNKCSNEVKTATPSRQTDEVKTATLPQLINEVKTATLPRPTAR